jgi:2'-5' RNA ligase
MRLFVAVKVPRSESLDKLLLELSSMGRGLKPVKSRLQHITLKFLGDPGVPVEEITPVLDEVSRETASFEMRVSRPGAFPGWKRPSVLWIGYEGGHPERLASRLDEKLHERIGSPVEKRGFKPHLTIARSKGRFDIEKAQRSLEECVKELREREPVLEVSRFELISSALTPNGPVYETVGSFDLLG